MKKLATLLLALAWFAPHAFAQNTQLSGTLNLPNAAGFNGYMYLSLPIPGSAISSCSGSGAPQQVMPVEQVVVKIVNGAMSTAPKIWGADCMLPTGLPYNVRIVDAQGNQVMTDQWLIAGSTFNIGTAVTTSPSPYANPSVFTTPFVNTSYTTVGDCLVIQAGGAIGAGTCGSGGGGSIGAGTPGQFPYYNSANTIQGDPNIIDSETQSTGGGMQYIGNGIQATAVRGGKYVFQTADNANDSTVASAISLITAITFTHAAGAANINIQATDSSSTANNQTANIFINAQSSGTNGGQLQLSAQGGSGGTNSGLVTIVATGAASGAGNINIGASGAGSNSGNVTITASNSTSGQGNISMQGNSFYGTFGQYVLSGSNFSVDTFGNVLATGLVSGTQLYATGLTPGLCVQVGSGGQLVTALGACGTGGGGGLAGLTVGYLTVANSTTNVGNSGLDEGVRHTNALTIGDTAGVWLLGPTGGINFNSTLQLAQASGQVKQLTLSDPTTPGDTILNVDGLQVGAIGSTLSSLRFQNAGISAANALNSSAILIGPYNAGYIASPYMTLSSAGIQVISLNSGGCVQADTSGNLSVTGSPCGAGGGGGGIGGIGTTQSIPVFTTAGTIGNSSISDNGTIVTMTEDLTINDGTSAGGFANMAEGTLQAPSAGNDILYALSSNHRVMMTLNAGTALVIPGISATAGTSGDCVQLASNGFDLIDAGSACGSGGGSTTPTATTANVAAASRLQMGFTAGVGFLTSYGANTSTIGGLDLRMATSDGTSIVAYVLQCNAGTITCTTTIPFVMDAALQMASAGTSVGCTGSGSVLFTQPFAGTAYKATYAHFQACNGSVSWTYTHGYTYTPWVSGSMSSFVTSATTSSVSITTSSVQTGFLKIEEVQ